MANQPPVAEFKLGSVKCLVWANDTSKGVRHNVTFARFYKDGEEWKETQSFGRDDMPLIGILSGKAHEWIYENGSKSSAKAQAAA